MLRCLRFLLPRNSFQAQFENMLGAREIFQLTHPQVGEHHIVGQRVDDELGGRAGTQDLAALGQ